MQKIFVAKFRISVKDKSIIAFAILLSTVCYGDACVPTFFDFALLYFGGEVHAKTNSIKFEKFWSKFGGSRRPPKTLRGVFLRNCHNSRTSWSIKLIIHSNDAE